MIVCSCNLITRGDIENVITRLVVDDPYAVLTPGLIYRELGKRGKCGGCFPQVSRLIVDFGAEIRDRVLAGQAIEQAPHANDDQPDRVNWNLKRF
ncbi:BFD-like [2Fe-2S] binding domain-containing protein [Faunimonas pinastri]|uniref:BFD-like [2Fe-2S] binding domain-containing protein n=1 Tax=Faunimonas pinastri TaxID=1855383 RepID=A0A1H9LVI1_9HYPH|nr:(2Fe-2S)-binding protein [Faunimonas pinastri]SER15450.1 BFD-like [2Fe-2S] binding domain-containing protein [Faunimonas pinastri]